MVPTTKTEQTFSVDAMMQNVALSLLRDFRSNVVDPSFCCNLEAAIRAKDIAAVRASLPATNDQMGVAEFKATYQMASLMKRYRFEKDLYSDSELELLEIEKFKATQDRIRTVNLTTLPAKSQLVLDLARIYVAHVLGAYSDEEHRDLCRFGRKASIGIPARLASEAARWELPLSGSSDQITWFDAEMRHVDCVQDYWISQLERDPSRSVFREVRSLRLTLVPKTFKSLRSIMPNTTIGSYMSYGLGEMIRKRLKTKDYDIRTLQKRHRYLACEASVHKLLVTADLSSASDSITVALVRRLLPPDWLKVLELSRISSVELPDGSFVESETFCTMGIGYTFPLQTLVFLSLLKAIEATMFRSNNRRTISVYGDDMIYSCRQHAEVVHFFEEFGFVINLDKTFDEGHFRESCGGDYYHGVDVRPFQPRNGSARVSKIAYEAILYKYVNGLLARWSEYEIEGTLDYLMAEVRRVAGKTKLVPQDYPDDSGVKCTVSAGKTLYKFLTRTDVALPKHIGHGVYRFSFLRLVPERRKEVRHVPYYWLALRGQRAILSHDNYARDLDVLSQLVQLVNWATSVRESVEYLTTSEDRPITTFRSKLTGKRLRRTSTYVTVSHTGRYKRQSGTSCFEDRS